MKSSPLKNNNSTLIEERSKLDTQVLVALLKEFTNSKRVNKKLNKKSGWVKAKISRLNNAGWLENKSIVEKTESGKIRKVPLVRLKEDYIFNYLAKEEFSSKEEKYIKNLINKNRPLMSNVEDGDKLYLITLRTFILLLTLKLFEKSNKTRIKSRFIRGLAIKIAFQTRKYRNMNEKLRIEWDNLASVLAVLGKLKPEQKNSLSHTRNRI